MTDLQTKPWTVKQLKAALDKDLTLCRNTTERTCATAIGGREIVARAAELAAIRKLTPGEIAIAEMYGYRAQD